MDWLEIKTIFLSMWMLWVRHPYLQLPASAGVRHPKILIYLMEDFFFSYVLLVFQAG